MLSYIRKRTGCGPLSHRICQEKQGSEHIPKLPFGIPPVSAPEALPPFRRQGAPGTAAPSGSPRAPAPPPSTSFPSRVSPASFPSEPMAGRCAHPSAAPPQWGRVATMDAEVQQVGATAVPPRRRDEDGREGGMGWDGGGRGAGQEWGRPGGRGVPGAVPGRSVVVVPSDPRPLPRRRCSISTASRDSSSTPGPRPTRRWRGWAGTPCCSSTGPTAR